MNFTARCVYAVVWNPRVHDVDTLAQYVLAVRSRAPDAPLVFVSTHADVVGAPAGVRAALHDLRAAGASHGQEITPDRMAEMIRGAGRIPVQRNTLYGPVARESSADSRRAIKFQRGRETQRSVPAAPE